MNKHPLPFCRLDKNRKVSNAPKITLTQFAEKVKKSVHLLCAIGSRNRLPEPVWQKQTKRYYEPSELQTWWDNLPEEHKQTK